MTRWQAALAMLGALGALFYAGVNKAVELDARLGETSLASAQRDLVFDARLRRVERRLGLKPGQAQVSVRREGIMRRVWHLIF